jgi:hypothetical protein
MRKKLFKIIKKLLRERKINVCKDKRDRLEELKDIWKRLLKKKKLLEN